MQETEVGWDFQSVDYHFDPTTKFAACYLAISILVFTILVFRFLPTLLRFKTSLAILRAPCTQPSSKGSAASPAQTRFEMARQRFQVALVAIRNWARLTLWILLGYSTVELAALFREISIQKKTGVSALFGSLAMIFTMWRPAIWFLAALCVAEWVLRQRLARSADVRTD